MMRMMIISLKLAHRKATSKRLNEALDAMEEAHTISKQVSSLFIANKSLIKRKVFMLYQSR